MATCNSTSPLVVVACASFKGTLSSRQAGEALGAGLKAAGLKPVTVVLADGGEGLVEAVASQIAGARLVSASVRSPLGAPVIATFALLPEEDGNTTAVLEMAASSGLGLVPEDSRDPKVATTWGVGEQIRAALDLGADKIILGLGGSATNDGGAGMAQALGVVLLDDAGCPLVPGGAALQKLARIDVTGLDPRVRQTRFIAACDVRSPLCGLSGASHVFGPQKGATAQDVTLLDAALAHYAEILRRDVGRDVAAVPGAGAAGGLGAGCLAFLNARLTPGIELVLDLLKFDALLRGARLVITGEGRLDGQTLMGKAPAGVAARAARAGLDCVAIGGQIELGAEPALRRLFSRLESLSVFAGSIARAQEAPAELMAELARLKASEWLAQ